jgi:hypothetical protein
MAQDSGTITSRSWNAVVWLIAAAGVTACVSAHSRQAGKRWKPNSTPLEENPGNGRIRHDDERQATNMIDNGVSAVGAFGACHGLRLVA